MWQKVAIGLMMLGIALGISATRANADFVAFEFPCAVEIVVDQYSPQELRDIFAPYPVIGTLTGLNIGTLGTVSFSYDTDAGEPSPYNPNLGFYSDIASFQVQFPTTSPAMTVSTTVADVNVKNDLTFWAGDPTLYDSIEVSGWILGADATLPSGTTTPLNLAFNARLLSTDLSVFSSGHLPAELNLDDFDTRQFSVVGDDIEPGNPSTYNYHWAAGGTMAPEPSIVSLLLSGLAAVGLVTLRKIRRTPR